MTMWPILLIITVFLGHCLTPVHGDDSTANISSTTCSSYYNDTAAQIIQGLYTSIVKADCELANSSDYPSSYDVNDEEVFDYIIVGAGTAGCVLANRLTEQSEWTVLLIEAGGNPTKTTEVPLLASSLQKTELDWQYQTEPAGNYCLGMEDNRCNWPRGKVLGGSSCLNFMLYVRGNAFDYDRWESEGNTGWGYESVLPYFKKSENMTAAEVLAGSSYSTYHGTSGYINVESWSKSAVLPLGKAFSQGMKELGYANNTDCNGVNQTGFVTFQGTVRDGRRCSAAKGFLGSITERGNLKVCKYCLATRVLINNETKTAYGVEFINQNGETVIATAKKEVILSAGAINSPQLLMLSGIGPKDILEKLNISVIKDLPVGKNLKDHMMMIGMLITHNVTMSSLTSDEIMLNFLMKRDNLFSSLGAATYGGFIFSQENIIQPDIEMLLLNFEKNDSAGLSGFLGIHNIKQEITDKFLELNNNRSLLLLLTTLLRPKSEGEIYLKSKDPKEKPQITAGYYTSEADLETMKGTFTFMSNLPSTNGLSSIDAAFHMLDLPGCSDYEINSNDYKKCYLRYLTSTNYHQCCSCKMGPDNSSNSVLDPNLRVKGIDGLMVIDASSMPDLPSGNINAVVMMIAEKGSDLIKEKWVEIST